MASLGPSKDGWLTLDGQLDQIYQPDTDPADSIRYFLNNLSSVQNAWLRESDIQSHVLYKDEMAGYLGSRKLETAWQKFVTKKEPITLGLRRFRVEGLHSPRWLQGVRWHAVPYQAGAMPGRAGEGHVEG